MTKVKHSKVKRAKVKRDKVKHSKVKRRSSRNTKRTKINRRTKRKKKTKRMNGGMEAQVRVESGVVAETPPEGVCLKKAPSRLWFEKYVKIEDKSLNVYKTNKSNEPIGLPRGSSIPDLTGVSVTTGTETFPRLFKTIDKLIISGGESGDSSVELAFSDDFQDTLRGTTIMANLKEAIENISAGREWNVSLEQERLYNERVEMEKKRKIEEESRLAEIKRERELEIAKKKKEETEIKLAIEEFTITYEGDDPIEEYEEVLSGFKTFLSELIGDNIQLINGFNRGDEGLIIIFTINGSKQILKISLESPINKQPCNTEKTEFDMIEEINRINPDITVKVYPPFLCITDIRSIVGFQIFLRRLEEISSPYIGQWTGNKIMKIPGNWAFLDQWWKQPPTTLSFSIIRMEYVEGIPLQEAMIQCKDRESRKKTLEDFRTKLNLLHEGGIYHCDLHNGNVIVQDRDKSVRIIDFGKAKRKNFETPAPWSEELYCPAQASDPQDRVEEYCYPPYNINSKGCTS